MLHISQGVCLMLTCLHLKIKYFVGLEIVLYVHALINSFCKISLQRIPLPEGPFTGD